MNFLSLVSKQYREIIYAPGFPAAFMSGFSTAVARLGAPDTGLLSYAEVVDQGR